MTHSIRCCAAQEYVDCPNSLHLSSNGCAEHVCGSIHPVFLLIIRLQIVACTNLFTVDVFGGFGVALSDWAVAIEADLSASPCLWRLPMCIRCISYWIRFEKRLLCILCK